MKKIFLALIPVFLVARLWAYTPVPYTEGIGFSFRISGAGSGAMSVIDESPVAPSVNRDTTGAVTESDVEFAWLRPGKKYGVNFYGNGPSEFWLSFITPKGYVLLIDDVPTDLIDQTTGGGSFSYSYQIELRPLATYQPAMFGNFSGIQIGKSITWEIGLGKLHNGRSAGRIIFKENDLTNTPVSRDRLYYIPPANYGEISVYRDVGQTLRQVYVPQGLVDIVDDPGGNGYTLYFYSPSIVLWKSIRVELASSTQLKITETEGSVSQVSQLTFTAGATAYGTGGSVTTSGGYNIHTFNSSGTFTATGNLAAEIFMIAGGGGGGTALPGTMNGGGGGAGGAVNKFFPVASNTYTVTVGAGGSANFNGGDSAFLSFVAKGGGAGAYGNHVPGGSGGNGGGQGNLPGGGIGYGIYGQGFSGGPGMSGWPLSGGGGGGSGAAGGTPNGGAGFSSSIAGSPVYYAGGGGAGSNDPTGGTGGIGGGGAGGGSSGPNGSNGTANTGGGGGGCNTGTGGTGGSGIVIIRYPTSASGVSSGNYTWTLQEGDGTTWLRTTTHDSTTYSGYRDDIVRIRTGGIAGTVVATTRYRYHDFGWGEEIQQVTADPTTSNLTTTYDYYTAVGLPVTNMGNYRQIKSITTADGNWTAYQYWDDWNRRGQIQREYHPYLDAPASVSFNYTLGRVLYMDYTPDWTGRYTRPIVRQETVNNVLTGQTIWSHGDNTGSGLPRAYATIYSYRDGSNYQTDYSETYRSDAGAEEASRPYLSKGADQTQTSFCDGYGSFNPGTGTFTYSSSGGSEYREFEIQGSTNSSGATSVSSWGGQSFASIYVIANRSTLKATIRDVAGNVIRTENWVCTGGGFNIINYEDLTYDTAGRLTQRLESNNATTNTHYTGGRVDYILDATGTRTDFSYDELGRVSTRTKDGDSGYGSYGLQGDIVTTNTYNGANQVTQTVITGTGLSQTSTAAFDQAGRILQRVANVGSANVFTTSYDYSLSPRIVKTILPGGATKFTETYRDGQFKQLYGTAVVSQFVTPSIDSGTGNRTAQTVNGGVSAAAVTTDRDWLGHQINEVKPGWSGSNVSRTFTYNNSGQLERSTQPGMAATLYEYDTLGTKTREGLDLGVNGALDSASDDRIMGETNIIYTWDSGASWWIYNNRYTYATPSSGTTTTTSQSRVRLNNASNYLDQRSSWDINGNETWQTTVVDRAHKIVTTTTTYPDSSTNAVQITYNGLLMESTDKTGVKMTYGYDGLGRQTTSVDPRTGTTTTAYIAGTNLVDWVKDPSGVAQATYTYDSAGRINSVKDGSGKFARYEYTDRDQRWHEFGDTTYPVEYVYNSLGQQIGMNTFAASTSAFTATWPASPNNPQNTTWNYHAPTGLLSSKVDANNKSIAYTYTQAGQIHTRTWARGVVTTYGYSANTGELTGVTYSDSTAPVSYHYNRLGQPDSVVDYTGTRSFTYNLAGSLELQSEQLGSFYGDHVISRGYATASGVVGRYNNLSVGTAASRSLYSSVDYGYDGSGRPNQVWGVSYAYTPNSHLISTVTDTWSSSAQIRTYLATNDTIDTIEGKWNTTTKAKFDYNHDSMYRITSVARTGEMFNRYGNGTQGLDGGFGYNDRSELRTEVTKLGGSATVLTGRDDGYDFDQLGNRKTAMHNGNTATYTLQTNGLNEYDNRTVPGIFDVAGGAATSATISVNGSSSGVVRHGEYFFKGQGLTNTSSSVYTTLAVSDGTTTTNLPAYLAKTPESFTYDDDGNLLSDGRWSYLYDAENRLKWVAATSGAVAAGHPNIAFQVYNDYMGRRILKYNYQWNGSSWSYTGVQKRYIYDGWNPLFELDGTASHLKMYVWGLDLSGTLQGAGGVGGLLASYDYISGVWLNPVYDGNGNVVAMLNRADGSIAAAYEYDAFGNTLRESGPYAASNPFRFSTKYTDIETGLIYYGLRYYSPSMGRFINKDPIEESGGLNLYGFCGNNGVNAYDFLGFHPEWVKDDPGGSASDGHGGFIYWNGTGHWIDVPDNNNRPDITLDPFVVTGDRNAPPPNNSFNDYALNTLMNAVPTALQNVWGDRFGGSGGAGQGGGVSVNGGNFQGTPGANGTSSQDTIVLDKVVVTGTRGTYAPNNGVGAYDDQATAVKNNKVVFDSYSVDRPFDTPNDAAVYAAEVVTGTPGIKKYLSTTEYGAGIYFNKSDDHYYLTPITEGSANHWYRVGDGVSRMENPLFTQIIEGSLSDFQMVSFFHTHPTGNRFSAGDADFVRVLNLQTGYVLTPSAGLLVLPHETAQTGYPYPVSYLKGFPVLGYPKN